MPNLCPVCNRELTDKAEHVTCAHMFEDRLQFNLRLVLVILGIVSLLAFFGLFRLVLNVASDAAGYVSDIQQVEDRIAKQHK